LARKSTQIAPGSESSKVSSLAWAVGAAAADDVGDAFDDQLGLRAAVGLVVDAVRVRDLVDEGRDLAVCGQLAVDHDALVAGGAIAVAAVQRLVLDVEAERGCVLLERREQVRMAVAAHGLTRRL